MRENARNVALDRIDVEYVAILDADDRFKPQKLEQAVAALQHHAIVSVALDEFDETGGRLRLVMRDPDGAEFGGVGRYVTLDRPHRLAFTWRWDSPDLGVQEQLVEVTFTGNGDGTTTVVLTNTGLTEREEREHREGWELSFANLDAVLVAL